MRDLYLLLAAVLGRLIKPILFLRRGSPRHIDANSCELELWLGLCLVLDDDEFPATDSTILSIARFHQRLTTSWDIAWSWTGSQLLFVLTLQPVAPVKLT